VVGVGKHHRPAGLGKASISSTMLQAAVSCSVPGTGRLVVVPLIGLTSFRPMRREADKGRESRHVNQGFDPLHGR
jgi:hypothetical protein